jgi:hypothetical protein
VAYQAARPFSRVNPVSLRAHPYPYRALLAICSDLDETPDRQAYEQIVRYLNGRGPTVMGPGLGLEVGNTIYFDMPPDQFAYWNTDDAGRELVRALIHSGHIDCFHSFGDLATTRAHAGRALEELDRHGCRLQVWIDHAQAPTNFGADIMHGQGDVVGSPAYHADLTCDFGVQYVWRGRVTSVVGQDARRRLSGIARADHPWSSARTLAKEALKGALARAGSAKYAMHAPNGVLRREHLRDGREVLEFLRSNPHWRAVDRGETSDGLAEVLVPDMLDRLVRRSGTCILYTHLGKTRERDRPFSASTCAALERLAEAERVGDVLVTTTRRLLGQRRAVRELAWRASAQPGDPVQIDVSWSGPASDLDGLTFYVPDLARTRLSINGVPAARMHANPADHTGRPSVSLPWPRLAFPL